MRRPTWEDVTTAAGPEVISAVLVFVVLVVAFCCGSSLGAQMTDFPPLSPAREVRTVFEDGLWHHRRGVPRDNTGDGQVGTVVDGDTVRWTLMMRTGTPPPGGAFWTKSYADDNTPYEGWTGNQQEPPTKGLPGLPPLSHHNIDTHHWVQNPYTGVVTWLQGVKPGARRPGAAGLVFAIQRATSSTFAAEPENYTRYPNELFLEPHPDAPWEQPVYYKGTNTYWGGVAEGAIFYDPFLDVVAGFYTAKTREAPDWTGQRHRSRIGRYACFMEDFDTAPVPHRLPAPGPESYVFDPVRDGAGGAYGDTDETAVWGTGHGILQMHVFIIPYDGYYHLVCKGRKPNTGQGKVNHSVGFAHYWSPNQGLDWYPDSGNPLVNLEILGWPVVEGVANRLNSPHGYINPWTRTGYLFFWGNPQGRTNKVGTRLWCMEFAL